jgi:hypothetical protein
MFNYRTWFKGFKFGFLIDEIQNHKQTFLVKNLAIVSD